MPTASPGTDLQIVKVPIDDLRPDPANPRKISNQELDSLTRSLREFGFLQPVIARQDGTVIGGHQRLVAARRLGIKTVPVVYVNLTDEQAKLLNLALNKISGDRDEQLLARLLSDLRATPDVHLSLSGFSDLTFPARGEGTNTNPSPSTGDGWVGVKPPPGLDSFAQVLPHKGA